MRIRISPLLLCAILAVPLTAVSARAQTPSPTASAIATPTATSTVTGSLAPNQTAAFGNDQLLTFSYTENFDCVDQQTDDRNYNGVEAQSDPGEFQTPICQVGAPSTLDPTGAPINKTDKLYVLVPFFSVDNDQNPNDAIACPPGARAGTLCGAQLGSTLISLFGAIPEGFKTTPMVSVQCPNPEAPPGTCTMHADTVDLFPALSALGKVPASPQQNIFVPTPNHDHVIDMDLHQKKPVWWEVVTVLVSDPSDWPSADGTSGITSVKEMQAAQAAGGALPDVPSNFFLFFGSQEMAKIHKQ